MLFTLLVRTPWRLMLFFMCIGQVLCEGVHIPSNKQMDELKAFLEEKFLDMNNRIMEKFEYIENKSSDVDARLYQIEVNQQSVKADLASVKVMTENIELEAVALGERSSQTQVLKEKTFNNFNNLKEDISDDIRELKMQVSSLKDTITVTLKNASDILQKEFQETTNTSLELISVAVEEFQETTNTSLELISVAIEDIQETTNRSIEGINVSIGALLCPESDGFIRVPGSFQCLKIFHDGVRTWDDAAAHCKSEDLELAKPHDPLGLRKYLKEQYDGIHEVEGYWIGCRSDGSLFKWIHDEVELSSDNSLWGMNNPDSMASTKCLYLHRGTSKGPYYDYPCYESLHHICERVMG